MTRSPWWVLSIVLLLATALSAGMPQLQISNDFRVYFSKDNPQLRAFEAFEAAYVGADNATFVVTANEGDLFTRRGVALLTALTEEAWMMPYAYRVSSLSNYQFSRAVGDRIETNDLIPPDSDFTLAELATIRRTALEEQRLIHKLMTPDAKLGLVYINLNLPKEQANASIMVTEQVEAVRERYRQAYPEFQIDNGGSSAFNTTLARAVANDLSTLVPLSYLVIFAGLLIFLRSFWGTVAIFLMVSLGLAATFGFFGWTSPVLTPIAGFVPSILLSIVVADSVHILVIYRQQLRAGSVRRAAIQESLEINFMPVLITSVTTMIGFLGLNLSTSPPYRDLGNMVAFGVFIAMLLSLLLLPALLMVLPQGRRVTGDRPRYAVSFADFVIRNRMRLLSAVSVSALLLVTFLPNNRLSDNWARYFDDSFELIRLVNRVDGYLSGVNSLEYSLRSERPGGIFDPDHLGQMDRFEQWYRSQPGVVNVTSLSRLMMELNRVMHGDQTEWERVPDNPELAAQYLLFYEFGLPRGLGLENLVTIHKDASRFSVSVTSRGSDELLALDARAQAWLEVNAPAIRATPATGLGVVFAHIAQRNITSLLKGTFFALIAISIVLLLVLKSFKYGLISLVPNMIPAVMAYGLWGLLYGYVDISLSIVACATLGIVVDDTVHFLHKYIRARRSGLNAPDAVRSAFSRVGVALLTTSTVLAAGFLILAASHMNTSATIGILMAITLIFALIVDFLLLPPLLLYFDSEKE